MRHTTKTNRMRSLVAVLLALVVVASACGDDSDSAGGLSFCEIALQQEAAAENFGFASATPEGVEEFFRDQARFISQGISTAPNGEVKSALETMGDGTNQMISLLEAEGWDIFAVDTAAMDAVSDSPDFNAASDVVTDYSDANCGTSSDDDDADDDIGIDDFEDNPDALDSILDNDAFRQQMVDSISAGGDLSPDEVNCLLDNMDADFLLQFGSGDVDASSAGPLLEVFANCGIDPTQFG